MWLCTYPSDNSPMKCSVPPFCVRVSIVFQAAGLIAANNLRGRVQPGQKVVVNGAGGGVGMFAVQIAKARGAEVTAVDNTEKLDLLRSLGADHVVDYTQQDFTQNGPRYDLMIDVVGSHSFSDYRRVLTPDATYVLIGHDGFGKSAG